MRVDLASIRPATTRARAVSTSRVLQRRVIEPILRIGDVRTDKRIDFVGGARGTEALERAVDSGKAAVAFSMYPVTVDDLMADLRRGRHHAAEVDLVRAQAARRAADSRSIMKVLIADKFEQSGIDGLKAAGCDVVYEPDLKDEALTEAIASSGADVLSCAARR